MTRKELKENAKNSLKGKWGEAIKLTLVYLGISFLVGAVLGVFTTIFNLNKNTIETLTQIVMIVVEAFLILGMTNFYLKISRGEEVTYKELFSKTNMFKVALLSLILVSIYTTLWTLLLIIPGIIAAISYSQTYFILLDNPEMKANEAITKSKEIMQGHKFDYFVLQLSFVGWAILGVFTLFIGYLWLIPYMEVTTANFYNSIKK